jgi:hypothetical protein
MEKVAAFVEHDHGCGQVVEQAGIETFVCHFVRFGKFAGERVHPDSSNLALGTNIMQLVHQAGWSKIVPELLFKRGNPEPTNSA